jgi:hypothetical protein
MGISIKPVVVEFGKDRYHLNDDMQSWCTDNFGIGGWVYANPDDWEERYWAISSAFGNTTFYFKDEKHATIFALRWQ